MRRLHSLHQLTLAKVREMLREPEWLFWIFAFPVLLALALGIAFRSSTPQPIPVGVQEGEGAAWMVQALDDDPALRAEILDRERARFELRAGNVALVVVPGDNWTYWLDPTRPESNMARLHADNALQRAAGRVDPRAPDSREMTEKGSRYIDFLVPGLVGMNLMSISMWGIGFYIVNARQKKLLKRLIASPMRRSDYLAAQILGRLVFLIPEVGILLLFARLAFGVPIRGSLVSVLLISVLGSMTFAGLGLLVASRPKTIEGVSGLMNVVMLPMWIMSGTFFSTSRFPDVLQPFIQALPLTAVNDALRAVMIEDAGLLGVADELAVLGAWVVVSFVAALRIFRWS